MNQIAKFYTIRIEGNLHERWKDWFDGMTVTNLDRGEVLIQGYIQDQSVLVGIINQIHNLNLRLIAICCESEGHALDRR